MMKLLQNISLAQYTTLHVGGVADYLVEVTTEAELTEALRWAQTETNISPLILGGGSNVLISDDGYRGLVVINKIRHVSFKESNGLIEANVGAGVLLDTLVAETVENNYWGLENLSAIPGTVGATPIQNVGAYGVEVSELIIAVTAIHSETLEKKIFRHEECQFGYRDSFFKTNEGKPWCVTEVSFVLRTSPEPKIQYADLRLLESEVHVTQKKIRETVIAVRAKKFPNWDVVGTAGSFFKNPVITKQACAELQAVYPAVPTYEQPNGNMKVSLGWLLDHACQLKGYTEANVRLFEQQALVLVAERNATASEIDLFAEKISKIVFERTKIKIEREVRKIF